MCAHHIESEITINYPAALEKLRTSFKINISCYESNLIKHTVSFNHLGDKIFSQLSNKHYFILNSQVACVKSKQRWRPNNYLHRKYVKSQLAEKSSFSSSCVN